MLVHLDFTPVARGLINETENLFGTSSNFTCARPVPNQHGKKLSVGVTFKSLITYITLAAVALTVASSLFLIIKHLQRYTAPKQQRQIIRMVFMPAAFGLVSLLSVLFYDQSIYIEPLKEIYQAFCIAAIFFLFLEYVCPDEAARPEYFTKVPNKDKKGNIIPGGSLLWYNRTYAVVLQYPLTKTLTAIVEISTQAANVFCTNSLSPKYAHFWVEVIDMLVIGGAVSAVLRFYGRLKPEFAPEQHALAKLLSFKGIVIFQFLQGIIFGFLNGKVFKPSATLTYDDIYYGLPNCLTAVEAMCFSFLFHWAFRSREYHESQRPGARKLPIWRAALDALNLSDIIIGIFVAFKLLIMRTSPNGHGLTVPAQFGGGPKRQRTMELRDQALEPLNQTRSTEKFGQRAPSPLPSAHYSEDLGAQRTGHTRNVSNSSESEMLGGYDRHDGGYEEYRDQYLGVDQGGRSRSPSLSDQKMHSPRDMV